MSNRAAPTAFEFFCGGGLAGLGLEAGGRGFRVGFANDLDPAKARAFAANHPAVPLAVGDVWGLTPADLPGRPDLCWASSPCQDLSLAGARGGLKARRSGAFWGFWRLMQGLDAEGRGPAVVVIENVVGLLTSGGGADFAAVCAAMAEAGYRVGALEMDAAHWLPQSRPRLFIVAVRGKGQAPEAPAPLAPFHSPRLVAAQARLPQAARAAWAWWRMPAPPRRNSDLADLLEPDDAVVWLSPEDGGRVLSLAAPLHRARIEAALTTGRRVGAGFRRVRREGQAKAQRLEVRFDGLAGCLRTPAGGSSRQYVIVCERGETRVRRLTGRECARLMGLPEDYALPASETAALKLMGDAVAVPVVRALTEGLLRPAVEAD